MHTMSTSLIPELPLSWFAPRGPVVALLVRHGATDANDAGRFRGWTQVPLNESGLADARSAALRLRYEPLAGIVSSPLMRAIQTASAIATVRGSTASQDSRLMPWNVGWFAGKSRKAFGPSLQRYVANPTQQVPGGESLNEFKARWLPALWDYAVQAEPLNAPWVLVTHTSNLDAIAGGAPEQNDYCAPGGVICVTLEPSGLTLWPENGTPTTLSRL